MEFYYDETDKEVLVVSVDGGLFADTSDRFRGEIEGYINLGIRKLIVDCTQLTRISSYGIGTLVTIHKRMAKKGGDVKLASLPGVVGNVIQMTGLTELLQIYPTVQDALAVFAAAGTDIGRPGEVDSTHPLLDSKPDRDKGR
jgi:anti-anti-sigma factor